MLRVRPVTTASSHRNWMWMAVPYSNDLRQTQSLIPISQLNTSNIHLRMLATLKRGLL